jgi:hypothetical protein
MQVEYKNVDPKLVVSEIRNGRSLESVQKMFGIKFKSEVQDMYLRGLMELGEIPQVDFHKQESAPAAAAAAATAPALAPVEPEPAPERTSQQRAVVRRREKVQPRQQQPNVYVKTANLRTIGQSGSITLNKALLIEQLGFAVGDSFEIFREDDRIVLKKTHSG